MNKYQELWQQWITAISKTALTNTEYYNIVNGIAAGDEKMYEAQLQKPFPDDIIAFYSVHNVAYHPVASAFTFIINGCSYNLLSFDMIVERYNEILDVGTSFDEEDSANNYIDINISEKINIKEFTNPKWIPFAETDQGNYLLYDTDPTDKGTFGQIIELQNDSWQRNLVANSIEDLIQKQIVAIEANPEEALPLYLIPKPNLWTFGETVVLQEISFMVCSQEKANALLPQIIMPMSEDVNYFGTLLDKNLENNFIGKELVFLVAQEEVDTDIFVLGNEVDASESTIVLAYIFTKNVKAEQIKAINNSSIPAFICLANVEASLIYLHSNNHFMNGEVLSNTIYLSGYKGFLWINGQVNAYLLYTESVPVFIESCNLDAAIARYYSSGCIFLNNIVMRNGVSVKEWNVLLNSHLVDDIVFDEYLDSIGFYDASFNIQKSEDAFYSAFIDEGEGVTIEEIENSNFYLEDIEKKMDKLKNHPYLETNKEFRFLDETYSFNSFITFDSHQGRDYATIGAYIKNFSIKALARLVYFFDTKETQYELIYYTDDALKNIKTNFTFTKADNYIQAKSVHLVVALVLKHFYKLHCNKHQLEPIKIIFPNSFGSPLPLQENVTSLQIEYGFSGKYANFLLTQNGFISHLFEEAENRNEFLVGSETENSYQDFRDLYAYNASEKYNDLIKNQESNIFKDYFFIIGSDKAGNEFVEVKTGTYLGKIGCIDHDLFASCDSIRDFFEELELGDYENMTEDERQNELFNEDFGLIAFQANNMTDFLENCFLYSEDDGITIKVLEKIIEPNVNHPINLENVQKVMNYKCVQDVDILEFDLDNVEVIIKKPYLGENGKELGDTINFLNTKISILIINNEVDEPTIMFNIGDSDFTYLQTDSPQAVHNFLNQNWSKIMIDIAERENYWTGEKTDISNLTCEDLEKYFDKYQVPKALKLLFEFEKEYGGENYSECFYIDTSGDTGIDSWCEDEKFLKSFISFACANSSGSIYAFWLVDNNIENCPIVVFGDEGGIFVVANCTQELIHLLTLDVEISAGLDGVSFYKNQDISEDDEDDYREPSDYKKEFATWTQTNFGLIALQTSEETETIIENAQSIYQKKLNDFLESFGMKL